MTSLPVLRQMFGYPSLHTSLVIGRSWIRGLNKSNGIPLLATSQQKHICDARHFSRRVARCLFVVSVHRLRKNCWQGETISHLWIASISCTTSAAIAEAHIKRSLIGQEGESWLRELWEVLRKTRCKCRFRDRENSVRMTLEKKGVCVNHFQTKCRENHWPELCSGSLLKSSDLCTPKLRRSLKTGKNGVWLMTPGQLGLVTNSRVSVIH